MKSAWYVKQRYIDEKWPLRMRCVKWPVGRGPVTTKNLETLTLICLFTIQLSAGLSCPTGLCTCTRYTWHKTVLPQTALDSSAKMTGHRTLRTWVHWIIMSGDETYPTKTRGMGLLYWWNSDKIWPYSSCRSSKVLDLGVNWKCIWLLLFSWYWRLKLENGWFYPPRPCLTPPLGMKHTPQKLEEWGYHMVKISWS